MFDLIPFDRRSNGFFNPLAELERGFFGDFGKDFPCKADILDQGGQYLIQADMPGFNKEDIHIDINGDCLTISAEHKEETSSSKDNFVRRERRYGSLSRSFDISGVDHQAIGASYKNGVLELTLPKRQQTAPAAHQIQIR